MKALHGEEGNEMLLTQDVSGWRFREIPENRFTTYARYCRGTYTSLAHLSMFTEDKQTWMIIKKVGIV